MSLQTCFLNSLFKQRRCFVLYSFQPPCVVVVNMDGKSSEAADAVKREVKLVEKFVMIKMKILGKTGRNFHNVLIK